MLNKRRRLFLASLTALFPLNLYADKLSTNNVQLLYGTNYADDAGIDDKEKLIFSFEHFSAWKQGELFFFVDIANPTTAGTEHYAELSPRLSLSELFGDKPQNGIIKDYLIAATWEMADGARTSLYGLGLALNIAGFSSANVNAYVRKSRREFVNRDTDPGYQITLDWVYPLTVKNNRVIFEGFVDYAFSEDGGDSPKEDNLSTAPRILFDFSRMLSSPPESIYAGIEYQIWRNKFGIDGVNENTVQVMIKWLL